MRETEEIHSFSLVDVLAERARSANRAPKRTRTRLALLAATAAELEEVGYHGLAIEGIVEKAGLARGTFYLYFANRAEAAYAVQRSFNALMRSTRPRGGKSLPPYEAIHRMNRFYVECTARNASLLAGKEQLMSDKPEIARHRDLLNHRWARSVLRDLADRSGAGTDMLTCPSALLAARMVIAMADEILREAFVYRAERLAPFRENTEEFAHILSVVWYRAIFGADPKGISVPLPTLDAAGIGHPLTAEAASKNWTAG